ncbi:MAG: Omp28-related outer membrane protein [Candidatus Eisenbacteria bacterium]|nr:Omp28-related outer membrane protein [Candidatus Latescibacterota bacterium]MBD3303335.1 Omp28-related outer membrane protein [Candidatus Eisenbacteria bacterium]
MNKSWFDTIEFNAIRYYASSGGLSVPESDQRNAYYGLTGYPTCWWNGTTTLVGAGTDVIDGMPYRSIIETELAVPSHFKITVNSVSLLPPTGSIDVDIEVMEDVPDISNMVVRMALTEDNIYYNAVEDWHEDVLRDMPSDVALTVDTVGEVQNVQTTFPVDASWVTEELAVMTFIQDDADKRIHAAASSDPIPDYALRYYALGERTVIGPGTGTYSYEPFRIYNLGNLTDNYTVSVALSGYGSDGWSASIADESNSYGSMYAQELAPGEHKELHIEVTPDSPGHALITVTMTQDNSPHEFDRKIEYTYMTDDLQVLFVDDDGAETHEDYFIDALIENDLSFGVWQRNAGAPTGVTLDNFDVIVWGTAFAFPTLDAADRAALGHYLDNGGRLFVTGQDIGWEMNDIGGEAYQWYQDYLHAAFINDDTNDYTLNGVADDPISDGIDLVIQGGDGANNQDYPSDIDPGDEHASVIWTYDATRNAAIRADDGNHRVVYMAFGFEAIDNPTDRRQTMGRIMDWLREGLADAPDGPTASRLMLRVDPNPVTTAATIRFAMPAAGDALLQVFGTDGRLVRTLLEGPRSAGVQSIRWDRSTAQGERLPAGVYYYRLATGEETVVRKLVVLN